MLMGLYFIIFEAYGDLKSSVINIQLSTLIFCKNVPSIINTVVILRIFYILLKLFLRTITLSIILIIKKQLIQISNKYRFI